MRAMRERWWWWWWWWYNQYVQDVILCCCIALCSLHVWAGLYGWWERLLIHGPLQWHYADRECSHKGYRLQGGHPSV